MKRIIFILLLIPCLVQGQRLPIPIGTGRAAGTTYATWDASYKGSNMTLSGGNLVATNSSGSQNGVMATIGGSTTGKSSGKWYWEITLTTVFGAPSVGIYSGTGASFTTHVGNNSNGYAYYYLLGGWWHATTLDFNIFDCGTLVTGDVIGVALDAGGNKISFYKNGTLCNPANQTISGGNYFPGASINSGVFTANFGASAFTYSVPSGYNSGFY